MKKIFFGMLSVVAMIATSCENLASGEFGGKTVEVVVNVGTPQIVNRADFSDGTTATRLQYAVYDSTGAILDQHTVTDGVINGSTTITLKLVTGNTYSVLFWASAPESPYTVDLANKTMTVSYANAVCGDEARDAFYKYISFTVSGAMNVDAELRRPFAQLNIGTDDYAIATAAGHTVTHARITTNAYKTLNMATGAVSDRVTAEFGYAPIPTSQDFPVANYEYMAMTYLLMASSMETVEVTFAYATSATGANEKTRTIGSVPVQRNHRTNLYGTLLTSLVNVDVEIKPGYDDYDHPVEVPAL